MLKRVEDGPSIVVCGSCRFAPNTRENAEDRRGGALLAEALRMRIG